jgi:hypothetical protein
MECGNKPRTYFFPPVKRRMWFLSTGERPVRERMTGAPEGLGEKGAPYRLHPFFFRR